MENTWSRVEWLAIKSEQIANMATALYVAMFESPRSAEDFGDAMYLFEDLAAQHRDDMWALFHDIKPQPLVDTIAIVEEGIAQ